MTVMCMCTCASHALAEVGGLARAGGITNHK